ncbi:alpha-N-arabinofuranosidase [Duganella callida]|uniref:Alpha-N-arabinofuranosidase n=2 Tax=Duganella callida TaxID=2561932 RepID=A0A4Y9SX13_9BURK|nr:alpha-N-arabinofuranosidase [Duganella callida]
MSGPSAADFHNPLVPQRADPQVELHSDGYYYYTATVPEYDRIELRRVKDLNDLGRAEPKVIWRKHDAGLMSANIWAPEIHYIDGRWYLYFTASRVDAPFDIRLYVLENPSPNPLEGAWTERGQIKTGWESFSLDATTFAIGQQRYLVWTQRPPGAEQHLTAIYMATYSASATDANYAMGMLTADAGADLLDPRSWKKSSVPVLASSAQNGQYGPGHNGFTTTPDGKQDILIYHARNYRDIAGNPLKDPNRNTRAQIIHWRADGTPDFGVPVPDDPAAMLR